MTKKEECFELFTKNDFKAKETVIDLAISKLGIVKTTAQTYYSAWRSEYKRPGFKGYTKTEKSKDVTENAEIITKMDNKITDVAEISTEKKEITPTAKSIIDAIKAIEVKEIKWKADVMKPTEEIFEVTRLMPVEMKGKYGSYKFDKDGVRITANEEFISKDKSDEALEALEIWERCYGGTNAEKNMS